MLGAAQTTIYDVVTNYRVTGDADRDIDRVGTAANRAGGNMAVLGSRTRQFGRGLMLMARTVGPLLGVASAIGVIGKSMSELNMETNRTIQLAAQFNLAFKQADDPARNFVLSMRRARQLTREIIQDAARLPGTSRDFFQIAGLMAGPTFMAGNTPADLRRMVANIALSAGFAGQTQEAAARQGFRMITGQATIGDNPLFASLLSAGLVPDAATFNVKSLSERFKTLDDAMKKLVANPMFRREILGTLEVQLGTLSDILFGPAGIGGELLRPGFNSMIEAIQDLNTALTENQPNIIATFRLIQHGVEAAFGNTYAWLPFLMRGPVATFGPVANMFGLGAPSVTGIEQSIAARGAAGEFADATGGFVLSMRREQDIFGAISPLYAAAAAPGAGFDRAQLDSAVKLAQKQIQAATGGGAVALGDSLASVVQFAVLQNLGTVTGELDLAGKVVNNTWNVKIDLKSDDSPEGIALSFKKAMEHITKQAPTRDSRAPRLGVGPSSL